MYSLLLARRSAEKLLAKLTLGLSALVGSKPLLAELEHTLVPAVLKQFHSSPLKGRHTRNFADDVTAKLHLLAELPLPGSGPGSKLALLHDEPLLEADGEAGAVHLAGHCDSTNTRRVHSPQKKNPEKKGFFLTLVSDEGSPQPFATMTRCVGNGNHQCRGSGIKQTSSMNGTTNQKAKLKKAVAARKGWGGKGCLKNIGKSGNK
eukprot:CAMPEP_0179420096 /NCGR_PEP_ID=MMETSP0799-20121207/8977_1 /TAXON_ID=46947 /ORGANISM="Geminigera cryophila, Strain CCMP2564" /LENGTH=204 /DNA_ID=CAMNT_0021193667 /DNA_START=715 /DNA_END=1329 /DNA_ORIENTATION=+